LQLVRSSIEAQSKLTKLLFIILSLPILSLTILSPAILPLTKLSR
jgi:hypothetical protein